MKKLFALTLAVAMVLSMASVAFASNDYVLTVDSDKLWTDGEAAHSFEVVTDKNVNFGDTVYVDVYVGADKFATKEGWLKDSDIVKNFKLKADWSKNGSLVESVNWEKVIWADEGVRYLISIDLAENNTATSGKDIIGTITIDPKSKNVVNTAEAGKEFKFDVALRANPLDAEHNEITSNDYYVHEFDADEEYEVELFAGMGMFVVNTYGQGDLVIKTDVDYNEGIENADPDVNYVYFNSNNATFNRLGDLYLYGEESNIIYAVNEDGSLRKIAPKYDEDEEAFVIRTRVIGNYVIAEGELNENALVAGVEKAPEAPVAPVAPSNPSTGAAC